MNRSSGLPAGARSRFLDPWIAAFAVLCLTSVEARAILDPYGVGPSGVFAVSCGGVLVPGSGLGNPIIDSRTAFAAGSSACTGNALTSSASSSFTNADFSASGTGTASLGTVTAAATLDTNAAAFFGPFPTGYTETGWIDTILINVPGQVGGAFFNAEVDVSGTLSTTGVNVFARFGTIVNSDLGGSGIQTFYQEQSFNQITESLIVSETLFVAVPFVLGAPFQFSVSGQAMARTSSSTSGGTNLSDVNFLSSVGWGGIQSISISGQLFTDFTATGTISGINWADPALSPVPLPAALPLFGSALAVLGIVGWRRRRQADA